MLEVLIGVGGFAAGYAVNWYFGHAALNAVEDELGSMYRRHDDLLDEYDEAESRYDDLLHEFDEAESRYDRVADAYATTQGKIAAIRDLIADTTRVRSSRIREVLGE